jgi:hypothetical protein
MIELRRQVHASKAINIVNGSCIQHFYSNLPRAGISIRRRGGALFSTSARREKYLSLSLFLCIKVGPASSSSKSPAIDKET